MHLSKEAIQALCDAIFASENPVVVEAYSDFDKEPLSFNQPEELEVYIANKIEVPKGMASIFVVYSDMKGQARLRKIELDSKNVPNHKFRYTWDGWGLISIQITAPDLGIQSNINANSEIRAKKWESTHPEFEPTSVWDWSFVNKHKNRLKRVLKKYA